MTLHQVTSPIVLDIITKHNSLPARARIAYEGTRAWRITEGAVMQAVGFGEDIQEKKKGGDESLGQKLTALTH